MPDGPEHCLAAKLVEPVPGIDEQESFGPELRWLGDGIPWLCVEGLDTYAGGASRRVVVGPIFRLSRRRHQHPPTVLVAPDQNPHGPRARRPRSEPAGQHRD
jgi:hypothetical protein